MLVEIDGVISSPQISGVPVVVKELLNNGYLHGDVMTVQAGPLPRTLPKSGVLQISTSITSFALWPSQSPDALSAAGQTHFTFEEAVRRLQKSPTATANLLVRMVEGGLVDRVRRGHYVLRALGVLGTPTAAEDIALAVRSAFREVPHRLVYRTTLYEDVKGEAAIVEKPWNDGIQGEVESRDAIHRHNGYRETCPTTTTKTSKIQDLVGQPTVLKAASTLTC